MDKLDLLGWEASTTLKLGDHKVQIRSTSKAFNRWLGTTLSHYKVRKSGRVYYSIVIAGDDPDDDQKTKRRFHILYRGASQVVRTLDLPTLGRALFAELETVQFHQRDDAIYVDAAALAMDGKIALIPGNYLPTMWKLSRRLHQAGVLLPLARSIAVDRESGQVIPTIPKVEIPDDAIQTLSEAVGAEASAALSVAGARREGNGHLERWVLNERTAPVAILTTGAEDGPKQPLSTGEAVYRLAGMSMNLPKIGPSTLEGLSLLAQQAQCYKLFGATGSPERRRQLLNDITSSLTQ
ncbi:MAG: hypothetical protein ACRDHO_03350 [Actinomycetota bacterium]